MRRVLVLDVGELYRLKETQVAKVLVKLDATHEDRALALQRASAFGLEMTNLIQSLPEECHCLILARGAVVGTRRDVHDLRAVQVLLGHSSPETTQRYVFASDDSLSTAVRSVA